VRIVSISTCFNLSDLSLFLLFFNSKGKKSKSKMTGHQSTNESCHFLLS
jgi:hypothetical protein